MGDVALLLSYLGTSAFVNAHFADGQPISMDAVTQAWRARQEHVRSGRFAWRTQKTIAQGALSEPGEPAVPTEDTTFTCSYSLVFDGSRMRFTGKGYGWHIEKLQFVPHDEVETFDGIHPRSYYPPGLRRYPAGYVLSGNKIDSANSETVQPLLLVYRALQPELALFNPDHFVVSDERAIIRGKTCVAVKEKPGRRNGIRTFWVDPADGFTLLRYTTSLDGKLGVQFDFAYTSDKRHGLVLSGWQGVWMNWGAGSLRHSTETSLTAQKINPPVDSSEFEFEFPPGTWVEDQAAGSSLGRPISYIVTEGGGRRLITREDRGADYEDLLNSAPGMAGKSRYKTWLAVIAGGALLAVSLFVLWMRSASRKRLPAAE